MEPKDRKEKRIQTELSNNSNKKQKKLFYIILLILFAIALTVILGLMFRTRQIQKNAQERFNDLAAQSDSTDSQKMSRPDDDGEVSSPDDDGEVSAAEADVPEKNLDWDALHAENGDIYAWLYIPGTSVDYPVLQHPEDDSYYLEHNLDGSQGYPGCIYTERLNSKDFTDQNTVIYGHDLNDGTMFHTLHSYKDKNFFEANRYAFIYTLEQVFVYDIFAAYESGDEHILYTYGFAGNSGFQEYLDMIFRSRDTGAHFRDGVEVDASDRIITLSTCLDTKPDKRFLVQGVLVSETPLAQ